MPDEATPRPALTLEGLSLPTTGTNAGPEHFLNGPDSRLATHLSVDLKTAAAIVNAAIIDYLSRLSPAAITKAGTKPGPLAQLRRATSDAAAENVSPRSAQNVLPFRAPKETR